MKKYGHTGTLFLQNGKYYKWSYKYEHCIQCKTVKFKHKGRGLCTSCMDKERAEKSRRKIIRSIASTRFHFRKRVAHRIITPKQRMGPAPFLTIEDKKDYKKMWYQRNKQVLNLKNKAYTRRKKGKSCLKMVIAGKERYFPFDGLLQRPAYTETKKYEEYTKQQEEFEILRDWYLTH